PQRPCSGASARSSTPSPATSAGSTSWRWIFDRGGKCSHVGRGVMRDGTAISVRSPPPCGEGLGVGVQRCGTAGALSRHPPPHPSPSRLRACPLPANFRAAKPRQGRGLVGGGRRPSSVHADSTPRESAAMMLDLFPSREAGRFGRRLKRARGAKIPVSVVTGFLGAGKTTLLRRFLAKPEGEGTAVVINEFGSVGIDDALVRGSSDDVTLLGNGCLCCNTRSDLQNALRNLVAERAQGKLPQFRRIVIETSGLADPGPILQTFATDRALGSEFHVEVVLAVVDAVGGLDTLAWSAEARKQVILADRLVVAKTDLAKAQALKRLATRLRALNPRAAVHRAVDGDLDPRLMLESDGAEGGAARAGFVARAGPSDG